MTALKRLAQAAGLLVFVPLYLLCLVSAILVTVGTVVADIWTANVSHGSES